MIASAIGMEDKAAEYQAIISQGERNIVVNDSECKRYENRKRFLENLKSGNYHDLSDAICGEDDKELMWCVWIMESCAEGLSVMERVAKLQKALDYVMKKYGYRVDYLEIIYMCFADIYKYIDACYELERFDEALQFWSRILTQDEKVNERIANAVKKGGRISMPVQCIVRREISLEALDSALRDFTKIVENEQRMSFFRIDFFWG